MAGNVPDVADVHVNAPLTDISIAYMNEPNAYVADKVFAPIGVNKQSDIIPAYTKAYWFRDEMDVRAPGTEARESGWATDVTATYFCKGYALAKKIPDEVRANADAVFDMDRDATTYLTDKALMRREIQFAAAGTAVGSWTTSTSTSVKWSDFANSDPLNDLHTSNRTVQQLIGRACNTIVMGQIVFDRLREHPDFVESFKYVIAGNLTNEEQMAKRIGVDRLFVCRGVYESAVEGASSSMKAIWDDECLQCYVAPNASLLTPSAGYTFYWRPMTGGGPQYIRKFRVESKSTDVVEVRSYFDTKVTSADAGDILDDCCD